MSVTYYKTSAQPAFNVAVTSGLPVWENPIPALNEKTVFRQTFVQTAASYAPLALDTVYPAAGSYGVPSSPTYYLVAEDGQTDLGGGMMQWDRVYARIPTAWSEGEEFAYTFPGFIASSTAGSDQTITNIQDSSANYLVSSGLSFATGDQVHIAVSYVRNSLTYFVGQYVRIIGGTSGSSALVPGIFPGTGAFSSIAGVITKEAPSRTLEKSDIVPSQIVHDYALASVTSLESNLPIIDSFTPVGPTGSEIQSGERLTTATKPTSDAYASMINNNVQIVAQASVRRRWLGNIYERTTRYIPAR
jgi:hypothetical protein